MRIWAAAIVVVGMVSGCKYGPYEFVCIDDASCGPGGKCEPDFNLCSFPDPSCPDGRSFGDLGGANSGQCVGSTPLPDGGTPDAPPDARVCFGTASFTICLAKAPTMPLMITDLKTIDTGDTSSMSSCVAVTSGGAGYCVVAATNIVINGRLRAIGPKPLVLVASDSISSTAGALIDVGSHRLPIPEDGAGANFSSCSPGTLPTNQGGGAGGSFAGVGGAGGNGNNVGAGGGAPGAAATPPFTVVRGGCPGQDGEGNLGDRGPGGHGGGAVYLIAVNTIDIGGGIDANGEGGSGGLKNAAGAGGGGSGGMIGLDAMTINVHSPLLANGGGGGEGCSGGGTAGHVGDDAAGVTAATGGTGNSNSGGDGGNGSAGAAAGPGVAGNTGTGGGPGGGGGGGGGAGLILAPTSASLGTMVSPLPTAP